MRAELLGGPRPGRDRRDRRRDPRDAPAARCSTWTPAPPPTAPSTRSSARPRRWSRALWPRRAWPAGRIDMRTQKGEHPRVGAMDVCPFVPVSGVTMDDCVACANAFGGAPRPSWASPSTSTATRRRPSTGAPCSRSGRASTRPSPDRIGEPEWKPDYGPAEFVPDWGATCAGRARLPDRLQRQRPRHEGAGPPHRARRPRAGPRAGAAGPAQGRARDRLVGRGVRPRPGLDQPRGLHDDAPPRGLRGLRGGGEGPAARGGGLGARGPHPARRRC